MSVKIITKHIPMSTHTIMYLSLVRCGQSGWQSGPCDSDLALVQSKLRAYKTADAVRIYSVVVPVVAVGDGSQP